MRAADRSDKITRQASARGTFLFKLVPNWPRDGRAEERASGDDFMAMTMTGEVDLPASKEVVWEKLNDPDVLKACIPGCQSLERTSDNGFQAVAKIKVGPVSATFKGKVNLSDLDPPNGYRISGEGEGGIAGFAKGGAVVKLSPSEAGTKLSYNVEAQVGGKIAQLGSRLIDGVARKMADQFFASFASAVGSGEATVA